jgi:hypothetical protein
VALASAVRRALSASKRSRVADALWMRIDDIMMSMAFLIAAMAADIGSCDVCVEERRVEERDGHVERRDLGRRVDRLALDEPSTWSLPAKHRLLTDGRLQTLNTWTTGPSPLHKRP